jgi:hypothetical protein
MVPALNIWRAALPTDVANENCEKMQIAMKHGLQNK